MKFTYLILPFLFLFISCNSAQNRNISGTSNLVFQQQDKEILEEIFEILSSELNSSIPVLMIKAGTFLKETPYVASTLEINPEEEKLVINLREMDCTTFAENCLAIARTLKSGVHTFERFTMELQRIRYRDGKIDGYPSRLHYFSDWIYSNMQKKLVRDISKEIAETHYPNKVNFMSTHPASYIQLKDSTLIPIIAKQEKEISARTMYYIPKEKITEFEDKLMDGDIAGITTNIDGLDIIHVVIIVRKGEQVHLLHASSSAGKVILSEETLQEYLQSNKRATGIMAARPIN